jgi:hypothetical protein
LVLARHRASTRHSRAISAQTRASICAKTVIKSKTKLRGWSGRVAVQLPTFRPADRNRVPSPTRRSPVTGHRCRMPVAGCSWKVSATGGPRKVWRLAFVTGTSIGWMALTSSMHLGVCDCDSICERSSPQAQARSQRPCVHMSSEETGRSVSDAGLRKGE